MGWILFGILGGNDKWIYKFEKVWERKKGLRIVKKREVLRGGRSKKEFEWWCLSILKKNL